jgi:hypothetical protein
MNISLKKIIPYPVAILVFIGISILYFRPVLEGKKLQQSDIVNYKASAKEVTDFRDKTGEEPLWTNSMFGGMPAFQISTYFTGNILPAINNFFRLGLPHPANILFLLLLGFFILMIALRVDPWLGIVGAIAFAFSTYFFIFLGVGHNSKTIAIAYMPAVFAGMILTFRGKYLWGGAVTALFMALEINANHVQMTYYLLFFLAIYGLSEFITALIKKQFPHFLKAAGISIIAVIISVGPSVGILWTSAEYMKSTIRGGTELTSDQKNRTSGLDKDYITQWSYGIGETFSLMIPDVKGGESGYIGETKSALDNVDRNYRDAISKQNHYWGDMPFTSGPVYVGAFIVFLFVLGLFIVKGGLKWALLGATILSIILSWGHNLMWLTDFFISCVPFYNKFRAVSSILVIAEFTMPVLAFLALKEIFAKPSILKEKKWFFYISLALTAGISLLFVLMPTTFFDFLSAGEISQFEEFRKKGSDAAQLNAYMDNLEIARIAIFKISVLRSVLIILLGAGILFIYSRVKKMSKYIVYAALGLLIMVDMWTLDKRYINDKNFTQPKNVDVPFIASSADNYILNDKDPDFRVLNLATDNFTIDAAPSYFHKSIGGYHAAKLRRYQDLIEHHLFPERSRLVNVLSKESTDSIRRATMNGLSSLNMLNTRYYIINPEAPPLRNPYALGNAWFVKNVKVVADADEEIKELNNFIPSTTAIIDKRYENMLAGFKGAHDAVSTIKLREYAPNKLIYDTKGVKEPQLAVFSEIYYKDGWDAYVDGQKADYFRANYVLRAMIVPPGDHTIEFRFEPRSFYTGNKISLAGSILLLILVIGALTWEIRKLFIKKAVTPGGK